MIRSMAFRITNDMIDKFDSLHWVHHPSESIINYVERGNPIMKQLNRFEKKKILNMNDIGDDF